MSGQFSFSDHAGGTVVITDALGREVRIPVRVTDVPAQLPHCNGAQHCHGHGHGQADVEPKRAANPGATLALGAGGVVVVGGVLVAMVLSVAIVAAALGFMALAGAVLALVIKSLAAPRRR